MDQDATWHGAGGGPGPGDFVLDGAPPPQKGEKLILLMIEQDICVQCCQLVTSLVMAALCNRGAIIFLPCSFFLLLLSSSSFFFLA